MKEVTSGMAVAVVVIGVLVFLHQGAAKQPAVRPFTVDTVDGFLRINQPNYRHIYLRPAQIGAMSVFHKGERGSPALYLQIGAKEYRLDCETVDQAKQTAALIRKGI